MNAPLQAAFDSFRYTLISYVSLGDIFEFTAEYLANEQPQIAYALNCHMRDYLGEVGSSALEPLPFGAVLAEGYRRTFCDPILSRAYGTEGFTVDEGKVIGMLCSVSDGLRAFNTSAEPQQVLDLAEAVKTGQAH